MKARLAFLLVLPVFVFAWIFLASTSECGPGAGCIATARVDDVRYAVGLAREMRITEADLAPYALATRRQDGHSTIDEQAYRLGSLDPKQVLVMKLVPGQVDDGGPIGDYLLLYGDALDRVVLCPYQPTASSQRPAECQ